MKNKVKGKFEFLVEAVKNWKQSGAITQSGPNLCKAMVEHIDSSHKVIVEFGAGDGVITQYILDRMAPDAMLLSFEINESLFQKLDEINDPRLKSIFDSAENLQEHLDEHNIKLVDTVISGIPFVVLPTELTFKILTMAKDVLKPGGLFVQFHYSKILKDLYQTIFGNYDTKIILMNTPPAFVFTCEKN
jgi:phosphatidylethanolamine/phosphatidyl-N-methylethanolamine N-methyltransferase